MVYRHVVEKRICCSSFGWLNPPRKQLEGLCTIKEFQKMPDPLAGVTAKNPLAGVKKEEPCLCW